MVFVARGRGYGPGGAGDMLDARSSLAERDRRNQIALLELGERMRNACRAGASGMRIPDDKRAPLQVWQQCGGRLEIQAQIFIALEVEEDYVSTGDTRVRMMADCILTRHLEPPSRTIGIEESNPRRRVRKGPVSASSFVPSFQCGSLLIGEDQNSSEPPGVPLVS